MKALLRKIRRSRSGAAPRTMVAFGLALVFSALAVGALLLRARFPSRSFSGAAAAPPTRSVRFVDAAHTVGVNFAHTDGGCGNKLFVEQLGSGCAFLDYDNDGWQDILLLRSAPLPGCPASK